MDDIVTRLREGNFEIDGREGVSNRKASLTVEIVKGNIRLFKRWVLVGVYQRRRSVGTESGVPSPYCHAPGRCGRVRGWFGAWVR